VAGEEASDRAIAESRAFAGERLARLLDRCVGRFFDKREDRVLVHLDPSGPAVSALGTGARPPRWRSSASTDCRSRG
jgi:hypothetical protein